jgi:hypothetical protein
MKATTTNTKRTTIARLFVMLVIMFASTSAFAQDNKTSKEIETTATTQNEVASSSMDFAIWFVGSAKSSSTTKTSSATSEKKQMINAGFKTNNVLIKKMVKKIVAQEIGIA